MEQEESPIFGQALELEKKSTKIHACVVRGSYQAFNRLLGNLDELGMDLVYRRSVKGGQLVIKRISATVGDSEDAHPEGFEVTVGP